jgi:hypothetical protein
LHFVYDLAPNQIPAEEGFCRYATHTFDASGVEGRWAMPTLLLFVRKTQGIEILVEIIGDGCGDRDGFAGVGVFEGYLVCVEHLPLDVLE